MFKFTLLLSTALSLFLASLASAQSGGATIGTDTLSLSLDESVHIGLEHSKFLHSSRMRLEASDAKASEANAQRFPSLKFGGSYSRLSDVPPATIGPFPPIFTNQVTISQTILNNYNLRLSLQHPLFTGFRVGSTYGLADFLAQATEQEYLGDRTELVFAVKNAYWGVIRAIEFKKVIDENVQQMQSHLKDIQNMFAQGLVTRNEVLKVEVQLSEANVRQIEATKNVELATLSFNNVLGQPLNSRVRLTSDVRHDPKEFKQVDELVRRAYEVRPELKSMEYRVKAGEEGVTIARSGWYPQIYLVGNYYYSRPNQRIFPAVDEFRDTWDVGVAVSWDIWNWGTTIHQTTQARAQLDQANDALAQLRDGVALEVTQSYLNVRQAKERIVVAEKGVAQAEENYRITNEKFKSGLAPNSDLLDAEVALLQAKWNYINALVDHRLSEARLEQSIGETDRQVN